MATDADLGEPIRTVGCVRGGVGFRDRAVVAMTLEYRRGDETRRLHRRKTARRAPRLLVGLSALVVVSCTSDSPTPTEPPTPTATSIELSTGEVTFNSLGETTTLTATVRDQSGSVMSGQTVTWTSSDLDIASVAANGIVTAVRNGSATITATSGVASAAAQVTVDQVAVWVGLSTDTLTFVSLGDTARLSVSALDANDAPVEGPVVTWTTSDSTVLMVDAGGLVTSRANGTASITATVDASSASRLVTVSQVATSIQLSTDTLNFTSLGDTATVTATVLDASGQPMAGAAVMWASSDTSVSVVDSIGVVTSRANGTATITATSGAAVVTASVAVTQIIANITIDPGAPSSMVRGDTLTIAAALTDARGVAVVGQRAMWASGDSSVASVDSLGLVTAKSAGVFSLVASAGAVSDTVTVRVYEPLLASDPSPSSGVVGAPYTRTLQATGGDGEYLWSTGSEGLPGGFTLSSEGVIDGTPPMSGVNQVLAIVTSGDGQVDSLSVEVIVYEPLSVDTIALAEARVGVSYSDTIGAAGGDGSYEVTLVSGAIPDGLALDVSGRLSGTPTLVEARTFTIEVRSGDGQVAQAAQSLKVLKEATFIEGYAGDVSIDRGDAISLHISTDGSEHTLEVSRLGWYGGVGKSVILRVDSVAGLEQAQPVAEVGTGLIEAAWSSTYTLQTDATWTSGVYLVDLTSTGAPLGRIMFVIRDDAAPGDMVVQIPVTTYQAYNNWGGKSLYEYNSEGGRAYKVSFDRPYANGSGAGDVFSGDYNLIRWLEREGYDASYVTSIDLERDPSLLSGVRVFISNFHDEYWSRGMRDVLVGALDAGTHAAFFDANNLYWQVRFEASSSSVPNRVMVGFKEAALDVGAPPGETTVRWRDAQVNEPENGILGIMYSSDYTFGDSFPWVVKNSAHWIYGGTGVVDGDEIPGLVGYEYDRVWDNGVSPPTVDLVLLAESPVLDRNSLPDVHHAAIHTRSASGAIVFAAGTNYWSWFLDNDGFNPDRPATDARVQQMTRNLLTRMLGN